MYNYKICIAGKNQCSIDFVSFLIRKKLKNNIIVLPNASDKGVDNWQPSLKKFSKKNKIKIVRKSELYRIKNLILFSIEYEKILKVSKFKSDKLFNVHFSLLPKYRGCNTNYLQVKYGEKTTGVTLHKIDKGIDTGEIIDQIKFNLNINDTAIENYKKLMKYSVKIFQKNFLKIIKKKYNLKKQKDKFSSYYPRNFVDYKNDNKLINKSNSIKNHNQIRSLIFPPYQLPIVNGKKVSKSTYKNNKIILKFA